MNAVKKMQMAVGIDWGAVPYGTAIDGGFYAGRVNINGLIYAILVAPKSSEVSYQHKTTNSGTAGTVSLNDGLANSNAMNNSNHPAAQYCRAYGGGGFMDWYLPAKDELEICYRNLKPDLTTNATNSGANSNSVPTSSNYTTTNPTQTTSPEFKVGGDQAFPAAGLYYWSSTAASGGITAWTQTFSNGAQTTASKDQSFRVRPVRRILIQAA
ncbi:DUF1566 domain-containing protein [Stutzerimonas stutzeri]|uniref:Lcl domain-containing protein n=1 Tax=Stutzerimonas stutzeri TaxID=316 RepID=UPI00244A5492|nr:DUF1566 domain-containing protein [Stutzerimonas stutzeri]MDH0157374.1 DUF1566 domain-containing protein [Stutzerimonas stutzeri]